MSLARGRSGIYKCSIRISQLCRSSLSNVLLCRTTRLLCVVANLLSASFDISSASPECLLVLLNASVEFYYHLDILTGTKVPSVNYPFFILIELNLLIVKFYLSNNFFLSTAIFCLRFFPSIFWRFL